MMATVCPFAEFFDKEGRWGGGGGAGKGVALYTALNREVPLYWIFFYFHSDTSTMKTVFLFILAVMIVSVTSRSTGKGE